MVIHMKTHNKIKITTAFISLAIAQHAAASGYHFGTQSVGAQSPANAAAAEAADASTLFYNPAGLTHLDGKAEITGAINIVAPALKYHDAQASYYQGGSVQGATDGKITKTTAAPHVYGAYKLNDRVTLGMGMYIPFGSKTDYQDDSVLRYNIKKLGLTSIALEPAVAFKFNEKHSFAVGLIAQYSEAELTKYADWSAARDNRTLAATAAALQRMGIPAAATANRANWQGRGDVKGHDWGFGYHLGWMFDVNDKFRLGVAYRSKVSHNLKGTAKWQPAGAVVQAPALANYIQSPITATTALGAGRGYLPSEDASVHITTPESLSLHGMYRASDKLNLFGDITWTRHSRFNKADLVFGNTKNVVNGQSDRTTITPNWRNTYKIALGGSYQYSEPLQLRAGIAFDQSPVKSAEDRLNTMPDANRMWFSVGARYAYKKRHVFDTALSYVHIHSSRFNAPRAVGTDVDSKGASSAKFKASATILGLQYTYKFE